MSLWDRLLGRDNQATSFEPAQIVQPPDYESYVSTAGIPIADPGTPIEWYILDQNRAAVEKFWKTQPNLRKVVGFAARNIASTPLHAYRRDDTTDSRTRVRDSALARVLSSPRPKVSPYRFWESVISDGLLYDRWAVYVHRNDAGAVELLRIPAWRLQVHLDPLGGVEAAKCWMGDAKGGGDQWVSIPLSEVILDYGYAPSSAGLSPVETLRDLLDENREAVRYRRDLMSNGARIPGQVLRPETAPPWPSKDARTDFINKLRANFSAGGSKSGQMPLMEDGMRIEALDIFKPSDTEDLNARRLSAAEVASSYYIAPELVGAQQGTFSNIDAFRQMLYGPSLGPYIAAWEGALNAQLVPMLDDGTHQYVEAFLDAKVRGSLLEQARVMQSLTGAPTFTRAEMRSSLNLPYIPGTEELIVPLNVLVGGQASPTDSGTQNLADAASEVIRKHLERQQRAIPAAIKAKPADWWDADRWNRELADDLEDVGVKGAHLLAEDINESTRAAVAGCGVDAFADREQDALDALARHLGSEQ